MSQDPNIPQPDHLPATPRGPAPTRALQLRGNHALGMPVPQAPAQVEEDDDTIDLRDLWRMVVKHKGLLVSVAIGGLLVALLLSFIKTPLYLATTTVQVDKRAPRVVQFGQEADAAPDRLTFVPHLVPVDQGELVSCYVTPRREVSQEELDQLYLDAYGDEPFIRLRDVPPGMRDVRETNMCHIFPLVADDRILVESAIDNLWKGASSQAIQNLNLMLGLDETEGLA